MFMLMKPANAAKINFKFNNLDNDVKKTIRRSFYDIGKLLVSDTKKEINRKPKTGKRYIKYRGVGGRNLSKPQYYNASAPGEAPAVVTGKLRDSVNFTVNGSAEMVFGLDMSKSEALYGKYLEYENLIEMTGQGSKNIKPRPFITESYRKNKGNIERKFDIEIRKEIQK